MKLFLFLIFAILAISGAVSKGVHINVGSNWKNTPLAFELAEGFSHMTDTPIWKVFKTFDGPFIDDNSSKIVYSGVWELITGLLWSDHHQNQLQYAVASRYFNPTVATHQ